MLRVFVVVFALVWFSGACVAQDQNGPSGTELIHQYWKSVVGDSLEDLLRWYAPGFRAMWISGPLTLERIERIRRETRPHDYTLSEIHSARFGDTIVVQYKVRVAEFGLPESADWRVAIFHRTGAGFNGWQLISYSNMRKDLCKAVHACE